MLIEFAILLPLLVILVFGLAEIGRALHQQRTLTEAVLSGARYLARAPDALTPDCDPTAAWAAQEARARRIVIYADPDTAPVTRLPGLAAAGAVSVSAHRATAPGVSACVIRVDAHAPFAAVFGDAVVPLLDLGRFDLAASAEERYIGD